MRLIGKFVVLVALLWAGPAFAQCTGQFQAGQVCGNSSPSLGQPTGVLLSPLLDQNFGSTAGYILYRGLSGWSAGSTLPSGLTIPSATLSGTTTLNNLDAIQFSGNYNGAFLLGGETANLIEIGPSPSVTNVPTNLLLQPPSGAGAFLVINGTNTSAQSQLIVGNNGTGASPGDWVIGQTVGAGGQCYPLDFADATPTIAFTMTCDPHLQIKNNIGIWGRNAANNADLELLNLDSSNNLQIGASGLASIVLNKTASIGSLFTLTGTEGNQLSWNNGTNSWKISLSPAGTLYFLDATNSKFPININPNVTAELQIGAAGASIFTFTGDQTTSGYGYFGFGSTDYIELAGGSGGATVNTNGGTLGIGANGATGITVSSTGTLNFAQNGSGTAAKYVCTDSSNNIIIQSGAC